MRPETLAFCLDDGERRLAYSADTGPGWSFSEFGAAVDLAICEATFRDGTPIAEQAAFSDVGIHLTALEAGAMARASGARSLLLTHLLPGEDREGAKAEAASAYGGEVAVAGQWARRRPLRVRRDPDAVRPSDEPVQATEKRV
ncbi:MAG: MBL fold metallo-hydrolase [Microthrixaceae bacterium]|nr:MBL fold metallo-hydrolase [Microthrixaceae bacterium]